MGREIENEKIKEKLASAASMPKDVVLGAAVVTIIGAEKSALRITGAL